MAKKEAVKEKVVVEDVPETQEDGNLDEIFSGLEAESD